MDEGSELAFILEDDGLPQYDEKYVVLKIDSTKGVKYVMVSRPCVYHAEIVDFFRNHVLAPGETLTVSFVGFVGKNWVCSC
jgi:hypothetical protein